MRLSEPLRRDAHLEGLEGVTRLGGGGANVALPLVFAGHEVVLVSCVGRDAHAERLLAELRQAGVDTSGVRRVAGASTRSLVLVEPSGERTVVNLRRARESVPPARLARLAADVVYVRSRETDLAPLLAAKARSTLVVAHVPPCGAGVRPAHVIVASEADIGRHTRPALWQLARRVAGRPLRWAVMTCGARGAWAVSAGSSVRRSAPRTRVVDATGAGDAFAAGLVHALAEGVALPAALGTAVSWGSTAVSCPTSALPRELVERLQRRP